MVLRPQRYILATTTKYISTFLVLEITGSEIFLTWNSLAKHSKVVISLSPIDFISSHVLLTCKRNIYSYSPNRTAKGSMYTASIFRLTKFNYQSSLSFCSPSFNFYVTTLPLFKNIICKLIIFVTRGAIIILINIPRHTHNKSTLLVLYMERMNISCHHHF